DGQQSRAAGEEFGRAAFVFDDMRLAVAERNAAGFVVGGKRQRVGGGPGRHEEDRYLTLEDFTEALVDGTIAVTVSIGRGKAACIGRKAGRNFRMGAGPVVGSKIHAVVLW